MKIPSRLPGESIAALLDRVNKENACAPERNLSPNAPLQTSGEGSRDQGIKELVSSRQDQGVFDSADGKFTGELAGLTGEPVAAQGNSTGVVQSLDAVFLDRYGDIMGVVNGHPLCVKAVNEWGEVWPQGLTNAMKELGIAQVIEAMRYAANYKAAKARDKFFWKQVKNLREGKPLGFRG